MKTQTLSTKGLMYLSPQVRVIEIETEAIICESNIADEENNTGRAPGFRWDD